MTNSGWGSTFRYAVIDVGCIECHDCEEQVATITAIVDTIDEARTIARHKIDEYGGPKQRCFELADGGEEWRPSPLDWMQGDYQILIFNLTTHHRVLIEEETR